jgi:hypothetical protein
MSSVDISPVAPAWVTTVFGNPGSNELPFLNDFLANFHHFLGHRLFAASRRGLPLAQGVRRWLGDLTGHIAAAQGRYRAGLGPCR